MRRVVLIGLGLLLIIGVQACGNKKGEKASSHDVKVTEASGGAAVSAAALVGHWSDSSGDHLYYSATANDGIGNYTLVQPNGRIFRHKYRLAQAAAPGADMMIEEIYATGGSNRVTMAFSKDGKKLTTTKDVTGLQISTTYDFADAKTEPQP
jgi:hypothetical protein